MLDFRMKHEGEPPARLLAQLRVTMKAKGLPPSFAEILAPVMTSADELDAETVNQLTAVVHQLERHKVAPAEALDKLKQLVAEMITEAEGEGQPAEDESPRAKLDLPMRMYARLHPPGPAIINRLPREGGPDAGAREAAAMADAFAARINPRHRPTIGARFAGMSLGEMAMQSCRGRGQRPANPREAFRMASHTTSDFPAIVGDALQKAVAREMEQITPAIARAGHEVAAENYRPRMLLGLSGSAMPQPVAEAGEIKHVTIGQTGEMLPIPTPHGALFRVSEQVLVNDDAGVFAGIARHMISGATERFRQVLLAPLTGNGHAMADGRAVFHADHGNLATTGAALDVESLSAARVALRSQRGPQGEFMAIEPWALVVPPQLETTAQQLLAEINPASVSEANPFSGKLELIVEAGLTDPRAWYLIGDPGRVDGLAYSFLDGETAPRVESKEGWEILGTEYRLIWNLGAAFVNHRSWFKNPGA